jgi:uncharacterized membrane protein (UPF0127 family)
MRKLIAFLSLFILLSCQSESQNQNPLKKVELQTSFGSSIETILAIDAKEQEMGLSGVKPEDFGDSEGMLFFYTQDEERHFWMPDTYFELDLFYLDKDLKIIDIVRKLPFYIGRANPELIPRARGVWCRHVLEMKSTSSIAQKINVGDKLIWKGTVTLLEAEIFVKKKLGKN